MKKTMVLGTGAAVLLASTVFAGPGGKEMRFGERAKQAFRDREAPAYALTGGANDERTELVVRPKKRGGRAALGNYERVRAN